MTKRARWRDLTPMPGNPVSAPRIRDMRKSGGGYNPAIVGVPVVFQNNARAFVGLPKDALLIGDGGHRYALAEEDGKLDEEVIALIIRGLAHAEMYEIRDGLNSRRTVKPAERFLSRCEQGDRKAQAIKRAVESTGWAITHERTEGGLTGTKELEWIWDQDHGVMVRAIETYEAAWGRRADRAQVRVLKGLGAFWIKYPMADFDRVVKLLAAQTVQSTFDEGRHHAQNVAATRRQVYRGIAYGMWLNYNQGLRRGRLPSF